MDGLSGMLEVVDTATVIIDGLPLRTWDLTYLDAAGEPIWGAFTVIERLGYPGGFTILPGGCIIIEYGESLRCYEDYQIAYNAPGWTNDCLALSDNVELDPGFLRPFPNPGTDGFLLELPFGRRDLTIFDALGRVSRMEQVTGGVVRVDASSLAPGVYLVRVSDGTSAMWMKDAGR